MASLWACGTVMFSALLTPVRHYTSKASEVNSTFNDMVLLFRQLPVHGKLFCWLQELFIQITTITIAQLKQAITCLAQAECTLQFCVRHVVTTLPAQERPTALAIYSSHTAAWAACEHCPSEMYALGQSITALLSVSKYDNECS